MFERLEQPASAEHGSALAVAGVAATTALEATLLAHLKDEVLTAAAKRKKMETAVNNAEQVGAQLKVKILKQIHPVIHQTTMATLTSR